MAGYQSAQAYDFSLFEPKDGNAARAAQPAEKPERKAGSNPQLKVVEKQSAGQSAQQKVGARTIVSIFVCCAFMFSLIALFISNSVKTTELMGEINAIELKISNMKSENVRLSAAIDGMFSIAKVDAYATDVLGMTKMENYQIQYVDLSSTDKVLYSGENSAAGAGFIERVIAYFTQLFA